MVPTPGTTSAPEHTDRRRRVLVLGSIVLLCAAFLIGQAVTADPSMTNSPSPSSSSPSSAPDYQDAGGNPIAADGVLAPGNTLLSVQAYGWFGSNNGQALIVAPNGTTVWSYDPPDSRVFDTEITDNGTVLASVATEVPSRTCPAQYRENGNCVRNRIVELDPATNAVVWQYEWYDAFPTHHEVHDADRLPNGDTAIIDMGNNRAFTVNPEGEITWSWNASEHLSQGSDFREQYGGPEKSGPESDWTHMNDIDRLPNGNFQLSIRNFDTVLEVDPQTNEIIDVIGRPGDTSVLNHQHNPQRLNNDTILVADSENDRVVEIDTSNGGTVTWAYDGRKTGRGLQWPRDADRLPNGNTLISDSRNFRVLEINPSGEVVWQYSLREKRGIVYDANRLGLPEEPTGVPEHGSKAADIDESQPITDQLRRIESWAGFVFPAWVRLHELSVMLVGVITGIGLIWQLLIGWLRDDPLVYRYPLR